MFAPFLTPAYLPFAIAFVIMVGIGLIEAIGLGLGHLDMEADIDGDGGLLGWLGLGHELPVLIWLTSLLGCFTIVGIAIQQGSTAVFGAPLSAAAAAGWAVLVGGLLNTAAANGLARIMPGLETTAITTDELLRRRGVILEGIAMRGSPARAKVVDQHGQAHFIMVEPHAEADQLRAGDTALLVRREGALFFALPDPTTLLSSI